MNTITMGWIEEETKIVKNGDGSITVSDALGNRTYEKKHVENVQYFKKVLDQGIKIFGRKAPYVCEKVDGEYLLKCTRNDYTIGAFWKDGYGMNFNFEDFSIPTMSTINAKIENYKTLIIDNCGIRQTIKMFTCTNCKTSIEKNYTPDFCPNCKSPVMKSNLFSIEKVQKRIKIETGFDIDQSSINMFGDWFTIM